MIILGIIADIISIVSSMLTLLTIQQQAKVDRLCQLG